MTSSKNTTTDQIVFRPKYPPRIRMTVYLYPIGVIATIFFIAMALASHSIFPYIIFALIFGFTTVTMPLLIFREARFGEAITIKRYFMPRRTIRYVDVVDLNQRGLVAKRGGIPLVNVENRSEFEMIIRRLVAQRKIKLRM